ncbi:MAG: hypothetical protein ACJAXJ_001942 [Colwellia sp.]|jgi:hypothetical protein
MKSFLIPLVLITLISTKVYSHSGGTDINGCHAGSQPYHCHNDSAVEYSSANFSGWDINLGYQYHFEKTPYIPYAGLSVGQYEEHEDTSVGLDFGLKHQYGWYAGYVTTSKSLQFGYKFLHFSANSDFIGMGLRFNFGNSNHDNQSSIYSSGSALSSRSE